MIEEVIRVEVSDTDGRIIFKDFIESKSDNVQFFNNLYEFLKLNDGTYEIDISKFKNL